MEPVSGDFLVLAIVYDLVEVLTPETKTARPTVSIINDFCTSIENLANVTKPARLKIDIYHSEIFWTAKNAGMFSLGNLIFDIHTASRRVNALLETEGFSKMQIGFGAAAGLAMWGEHEAFGATITKAQACAKAGIERDAVVIAEDAVSLINPSGIKELSFVSLAIPGVPGKEQKVTIQELKTAASG